MEKYCRDGQTAGHLWLMHVSCWIPKATYAPSECIIFIAFFLRRVVGFSIIPIIGIIENPIL